MMKFPRPPRPGFLAENYKAWGREYKTSRDENPSAAFRWKSYLGERVNMLILTAFGSLADHCAFCDGYPLGPFARQTIEHFRPKSQHPRLVYAWGNLFPCCDQCQSSKREQFDRKLLKPDVETYEFERYFLVNYRTGDVEVNPLSSKRDQDRAQFTIELYGLNKHGRSQSRLSEYRKYRTLTQDGEYMLDDFSYRFFLV